VAKCSDQVRIAVTGASEGGVFRWIEAETKLTESFDQQRLADLNVPEADMIEDVHGTRAYRAHLIKVMAQRAITAATS
jgi:carbon-monoxide dehydrogenase medium subunit